jgi:hypothetical protein
MEEPNNETHEGHNHETHEGHNHESNEEKMEYEFHEEEMDTHEVAVAAYNRVDALIELLIKKGIITEDEYDAMEEEMFFQDEEGDAEKDESPTINQ